MLPLILAIMTAPPAGECTKAQAGTVDYSSVDALCEALADREGWADADCLLEQETDFTPEGGRGAKLAIMTARFSDTVSARFLILSRQERIRSLALLGWDRPGRGHQTTAHIRLSSSATKGAKRHITVRIQSGRSRRAMACGEHKGRWVCGKPKRGKPPAASKLRRYLGCPG